MARRYVRDNRGRFASVGATARGGRLKTAGGSKRQTQTMQASAAPRAGAIRGKVKRDPTAAGRVGQSAAAPAATTRLKRSGAKTRVGATETNLERGRRGVASMSPAAKAARRSDVAERRSERLERITERQSGIVARRQINRASNYNPDGTFNQAAANANQRRLKRSQQLQERLRTAATGPAIASGALARKKPAKPAAAAAAKPKARKVDLSQGAFESRASATEKRARAAERAVQGLDRSNPQNRRAFNRADALRSAADSYSSLARRGRTGDLPASALFQGRFRGSTAPKLTRSQKAAATRQANKDRKLAEQIKAMERARRR